MGKFQLETIDLVVMCLYAVFIIGYGLYSAKAKSSEEYFLAGRNMTWPIVGISLFAANISSSTLVGLAAEAYRTNTQVFNYEWSASVVLVFFAIFFLPFYLKSKIYTMPEFLERRFDARSRYYFSFVTIVGNVLIDTAAALYVGTVVLKLLFPDLSTAVIVGILALCAAAYTIPGGLNSVIQTEVIQAILLVIGSCLITYYAFGEVGGWDGMIAGLNELGASGELPKINKVDVIASGFADTTAITDIPIGERVYMQEYYQPSNAEEVLSLIRPENDEFMPWTGLVLGVPILGFYFWANNQFMVQRVLGAKNVNHGRWGALFAGLLKLPVLFIMVIPGTLAILMFNGMDITGFGYKLKLPDGGVVICANLIDCPNATYPLLLQRLLPAGVLGLVLAGLLAAMMSSVSATFNSASTLITMDFIQKIKPDMTSKQLVRSGQISTLVLVVLACLWAPQIEKFDSLFGYLQIVLSFIAPPVAGTFIVGLFWKRANASGSFFSLMFGFAYAVAFLVASVGLDLDNAFTNMHFLHRTCLLFCLCIFVHILISSLTAPPPPEKTEGYTWSRKILDEETAELVGVPWYKNYRVQSILLLVATMLLVGWFW